MRVVQKQMYTKSAKEVILNVTVDGAHWDLNG